MMRKRPVIRTALDGTKKRYESVKEAAEEQGISIGYLSKRISSRRPIRGYKYEYAEDSYMNAEDRIVCPFYICKTRNAISCGGFSKYISMNTMFDSMEKRTTHILQYCADMNYKNCKACVAIMDILNAVEERKKEKTIEQLRCEVMQ